MAKADTVSTRAPRGSKVVAQAFFTALDSVPAMQQAAVIKAALTMIRDEAKIRRAKASTAATKERARGSAKSRIPAMKVPTKKTVAKKVLAKKLPGRRTKAGDGT